MRVKVMSIHGCQLTPSSLRSHLAVMPARSGLTVRVDRTAPHRAAGVGGGGPGHRRDVAQVVVGTGGERVGRRVILADQLQRLDRLVPDHHIDVVDQEEAAGKPLVHIGAGDRDRRIAHDP
jgi:hypothetical protein